MPSSLEKREERKATCRLSRENRKEREQYRKNTVELRGSVEQHREGERVHGLQRGSKLDTLKDRTRKGTRNQKIRKIANKGVRSNRATQKWPR